jgi:protein-tyrosine phosphatase
MEVSIYSHKKMEQLLEKDVVKNAVVIRFYDDMSDELKGKRRIRHLFEVKLSDIGYDELADYGVDYADFFPEADELATFIHQAKLEGVDIICQCEYGQGRSAGCAAAILEYFEHTGIQIFADFRYYPNKLVYHKVYDALQRNKDQSPQLVQKSC